MPPKKPADNKPNKKTVEKKKEKVIEDKTFGLKNKKGAKQQKFIKNVEVQVKQDNVGKRKAGLTEQEKVKALKDKKEKEKEELNLLFKPVQQTVGKGVDPKSVLCSYFKDGRCTKGDNCKFSHDLNIHRKTEKRSVYADAREEKDDDTMASWDLDYLTDVVEKKSKGKQPPTNIICTFFLDAVERSTYGWFWECPNGEKCIYKHCLPPGYTLKKDMKKTDTGDKVSLEELIEKERASLGATTTKVTLETFMKWKEKKRQEKVANLKAEDDKKKRDFKMGQMSGISGRQMFEFNPDLVGDDDDDTEGTVMTYLKDDEADAEVVDIQLETLTLAARESDNSGTMSDPSQRLAPPSQLTNGIDDESLKLSSACADGASINHNGGEDENSTDVVIDEDLFMDEDLDALDELDDDIDEND